MNQKVFSMIIIGVILIAVIFVISFIVKTLKQRFAETDMKLPDLDEEEQKKIKFKSSVSTKIPKSNDEIKEKIDFSDNLTLEDANKTDNTSVVQSVKLPEVEDTTIQEEKQRTKAIDDFDKMIEEISNEDAI